MGLFGARASAPLASRWTSVYLTTGGFFVMAGGCTQNVSGNCMTKKALSILFCILVDAFAVGQNTSDEIPIGDTINYELGESKSTDSLHFQINRHFYKSGEILYEGITNLETGLRHERIYLPDGKLESEGTINEKGRFHLGLWKYRLPDGTFKTIDFDSKRFVSRDSAVKIARSTLHADAQIEVDEVLLDRAYYWKVIIWTKEFTGGAEGEYLYIRRSDGTVTIPDKNEVERFD